MRPSLISLLSLSLFIPFVAPSPAAADQIFGASVGYFALRGEDARVADDVLSTNLESLAFRIRDFNNASLGAEYLVGIGDYLEAGVGIGFYRRTVPSVYAGWTDVDGTEIEQDMKLRIVPITATVRVLPFGRRNAIQPYVGGGIGLYSWRYSEVGEFVDFNDNNFIFRDRYTASGTETGPVALAGIRVPVGSQWSVGGELRYQKARGYVGRENGFLNDRIDLGGYTTQFTVNVGF
jgi:opacity protein-like surface antigen